MTLCENLYPEITLHTGKLKLPRFESNSTVTADVAVDFLQQLLKDPANAKTSLKSVREVTISWGDVDSNELPSEQTFDMSGRRVPISSQCRAVLEDLKQKQEFESTVFVVQAAVLVSKLTYKFKAEAGSGIDVGGKLKALLGFKAGVTVREVDTTTLEIDEPTYLGYVAVALRDMVPTGLLGAETAVISGRILSTQELRAVLGE